MKNSRLMLVDSDPYSSSVLMEDLSRRGFDKPRAVAGNLKLSEYLRLDQPDIVIFNYHFDRPDSLSACSTIKLSSPLSSIVVIVSPGPALKSVRSWATQNRCIDAIIEKPLSDERFFTTLEDLLNVKESSRRLEAKAERLANLVSEGALSAIEGNSSNEAEMFEAAVLFTDVRDSSRLIREIPPREFFRTLNQLLSAHAQQIKRYDGSVIKYTGDGVMAVFRGMGRSYLALRCAMELASVGNNQKLPFGVGVAQGLVLGGLIGDSNQAGQRRQYDVIGATVHLAARLCGIAGAGEIITTKNFNNVVKIEKPVPRSIGSVSIKGFDKPIDCVAFNLSNQTEIRELRL